MKKKLLSVLATILISATVCVAVGCKDKDEDVISSSSPSSEQAESFAQFSDFTLAFGESKTLTANGENLVWQSSDTTVATVSQNGEVFGKSLGEDFPNATKKTVGYFELNGDYLKIKDEYLYVQNSILVNFLEEDAQ